MDIARPELKIQKRRRQIVLFGVGTVLVVAVSIGVMRLKPAAPSVERGTVWTDVVKRGSMLRQVRGPGSLMPVQEAVERLFLPLMKLTIPELVDFNLPVEGIFHNLMILSIRKSSRTGAQSHECHLVTRSGYVHQV